MLKIEALPAFTDNYIWLLQDAETKRCAVVDPGDAAPVLAWLQAHSEWQLTDILITHHHPDHVGGVERIKRETGARVYGPASEAIPARDHALADADRIQVLGHELEVLAVPGHTLGHIAYFHADPTAPWLMSGDTLFAGGCGRLFEGTPVQMFTSLERLAALPANTRIYCAHEYTLSNLRFALAVEPDNAALQERLESVERMRASQQITLPSEIRLERATNPFLRSTEKAVAEAVERHSGTHPDSPAEVFAALRAWKDRF